MGRIKEHFHDEICRLAAHEQGEYECETCKDTGKVLAVRAVAGEAYDADLAEVDCSDC